MFTVLYAYANAVGQAVPFWWLSSSPYRIDQRDKSNHAEASDEKGIGPTVYAPIGSPAAGKEDESTEQCDEQPDRPGNDPTRWLPRLVFQLGIPLISLHELSQA